VSDDWFVGFRPHLKRPANLRRAEHRVTRHIDAPLSALFTALTQDSSVGKILDETVRFDARQGGKLRFISKGDDGYGGTYSLIQVPRRVIVVTERHGELDFRLSDKGPTSSVDLRATRMSAPEDTDAWVALVEQVATRLSEVVTEG
jgi:uncharacterized protein YndB with AHSA1/START domain